MDFRDILRTKREELNISQAELAEKLNVSRQTIIKWEKGENCPDMINLVNLSKIFGVTIDELVGGSDVIQADAVEDAKDCKTCAEGDCSDLDAEDVLEERPSELEEDSKSKYNIMLILAVLSLLIPHGIGLLVAIYVRLSKSGKRNGIVKIVSSISIVISAFKILLFVALQLLWFAT